MIKEFKESSTNALLKIGDIEILRSFKTSKQLGYYTFIWTADKAITIQVDSISKVLEPNSITALTPLQIFKLDKENAATVYQFNKEFYCIWEHDKEVSCTGILFFGNKVIPSVVLKDIKKEKFETLHHILLDEIATKDTIQAEMLRVLIKRFIIKTTQLIKAEQPDDIAKTSKMELLREFNMLVEQHYKEEHQVNAYAEMMNKSAKTLSNSFAAYNKSPLNIIHDRIILEAKRQLYYSEISSKEIAFNLGFDDPSHFSRLFKKHTGESPTTFKAKVEAQE
jgi:AraC-like DNA-binding protein